MYMLGQAATLRDRSRPSPQLHREIAEEEPAWLDRIAERRCPYRAEPDVRSAAVGRRDRRHVGDRPGAADVRTLLGEHAARASTRSPRSRRPLGLAALLRPRPQGARQDHLEVGRVRPRHPVRPAPLRHAADEPAVDRAAAPADARSRPRGARRRRLRATGRSLASGRPSSSGWAAARRNSRWATPSARTCRCSTR